MTSTHEYVGAAVAGFLGLALGVWLCYTALADDRVDRVLTQRVRYRALTTALITYLIVAIPCIIKAWALWNREDEVNPVLALTPYALAVFGVVLALLTLGCFVFLYCDPAPVAYKKKDGYYRLVKDVRRGHVQWYDLNDQPVERTRAVL